MFGAQLCSPVQKSAHKITGATWRTKILGFQSCLKLVKALVSIIIISTMQCSIACAPRCALNIT